MFLRVLRGECRVSPTSPNKAPSDPSNRLHCPLAATAATASVASRETDCATTGTEAQLPPEITALRSATERERELWTKVDRRGEVGPPQCQVQSSPESPHDA